MRRAVVSGRNDFVLRQDLGGNVTVHSMYCLLGKETASRWRCYNSVVTLCCVPSKARTLPLHQVFSAFSFIQPTYPIRARVLDSTLQCGTGHDGTIHVSNMI